jgi:NAD-dependent deacetylase
MRILQKNSINIVFFTGAGMSQESGLPTFRGKDGIWNEIDAEAVASARNWYSGGRNNCKELRQRMLDFFNPIRRMIMEKNPNEGHRIIAELQQFHHVTVITQNGDDFHERAGSTDVIHLHGEALKNASTLHRYESFDIDRTSPDIHIGDKAKDGSQVRPYVIFFDEDLEMEVWKRAVAATKEADMYVVVGCSLMVFPAVDLLGMLKPDCELIVINPQKMDVPAECRRSWDREFLQPASAGLQELYKEIIIPS